MLEVGVVFGLTKGGGVDVVIVVGANIHEGDVQATEFAVDKVAVVVTIIIDDIATENDGVKIVTINIVDDSGKSFFARRIAGAVEIVVAVLVAVGEATKVGAVYDVKVANPSDFGGGGTGDFDVDDFFFDRGTAGVTHAGVLGVSHASTGAVSATATVVARTAKIDVGVSEGIIATSIFG